MNVVDTKSPIFEGLPLKNYRDSSNWNRECTIVKDNSTVWINYDNKDPGFLYWKYGNGYIAQGAFEVLSRFFEREERD